MAQVNQGAKMIMRAGKISIASISLLSLFLTAEGTYAAGTTPTTTKTSHPETTKTTVHRSGKFGQRSTADPKQPDHTVTATERRLGTPAHGVNILNSTITNRIDTRTVTEHMFLVGHDTRLQLSKPDLGSLGKKDSGSNVMLTGKGEDVKVVDGKEGGSSKSEELGAKSGASKDSPAEKAAAGKKDENKATHKTKVARHSRDRRAQQGNVSANSGPATSASGDGSGGSMGYGGSVPADLTEAAQQLSKVIQDRSASWLGNNNRLTLPQVERLTNDARITGQEAAALGSLALHLVDPAHVNTNSMSKEELMGLTKDSQNGSSANKLVRQYKAAITQIAKETSDKGLSLWGPTNAPPTLDEMHQWSDGDCYLVSAASALVQRNPEALTRMITQTGPDVFSVKFPALKEPINVKLTQGQISMFSHTVKSGCWLAVLAQAEAKAETVSNVQTRTQSPLGDLLSRGNNVRTFSLLTGKQYASVSLNRDSLGDVSKILTKASKHGDLIGINSKDKDLSVLGWDSKEGELTIWDPEKAQDMQRQTVGQIKTANSSEAALAAKSQLPAADKAPLDELHVTLAKALQDGVSAVSVPKNVVPTRILADPQNKALTEGTPFDAGIAQLDVAESNLDNLKIDADAADSLDKEKTEMASAVSHDKQEVKNLPFYMQKTQFHGNEVFLGQGSILLSHEKRLVVHTACGNIVVAPKACAFIVQIGQNIAVYNLSDNRKGDVLAIVKGPEKMPVAIGHELVLSRKESDFVHANPGERIEYSNVQDYGDHHGVHMFDATFSPVSALDNAPQFQQLIASPRADDKAISERILKSMAVLMAIQ